MTSQGPTRSHDIIHIQFSFFCNGLLVEIYQFQLYFMILPPDLGKNRLISGPEVPIISVRLLKNIIFDRTLSLKIIFSQFGSVQGVNLDDN